MVSLDQVDVSIGIPPVEISGSFRPTRAERLAAWELLVELGSRTTVAPLSANDGLIREALSSLYQVFGVTRELLRAGGPAVGRTHGSANLSLGVIALRVLNEILRPALSVWHPKLKDHEDRKPAAVGARDWEVQWPHAKDCRADLNKVRTAVRSYIDTLGRIAGTPAVADSVVPLPPAILAPLDDPPAPGSPGFPSGGFQPQGHMVRWWDLVTGIRTLSKLQAGEKADDRRLHPTSPAAAQPAGAAAAPAAQPSAGAGRFPTHQLTMQGDADVVVDYVADMGDAFDPTMAVAWQLGRPRITLPRDLTGELPEPGTALRRGDLLILGGDEVYPWASGANYERQLLTPYGLAGIDLTSDSVVAIPGNHDYYGDVTTFDDLFVRPRAPASQDRRWFTVALPHGWWIWGFDTGLHGQLDQAQIDHFDAAAAALGAEDRVIICTPVPLWQLRQKHPDQYRTFRQRVDNWLAGRTPTGPTADKKATAPLLLSGDSHYFAQYDDLNRNEQHVTSGGGGAFLHPTHSLAERIPYDRGRAEFQLRARWPSPSDSRSLSRGLSPYLSSPFLVIIALVAGLVWGTTAWWGGPGSWIVGAVGIVGTVVAGRVGSTPNAREGPLGAAAGRYGFGFGFGLAVAFVAASFALQRLVDDVAAVRSGRWAWLGAGSIVAAAALIALFVAGVQFLCRRMRLNDNLAFSVLSSPRYKHFVRLRLDPDGSLTAFVVGIDPIGRSWWKQIQRQAPLPPSDPDGSPHLHYVWGRRFPAPPATP